MELIKIREGLSKLAEHSRLRSNVNMSTNIINSLLIIWIVMAFIKFNKSRRKDTVSIVIPIGLLIGFHFFGREILVKLLR